MKRHPSLRKFSDDHHGGLVMTLIEEDLSGEVSTDTLRRIGERLEAHIRLEERRVFPLVEATLPDEGLEEVGARLGAG